MGKGGGIMADAPSPTPGPKAMKKAGSRSQKSGGSSPGGGSPQPGNQRRRQSMLILDLQSKKKAILQQILDVRQELVMLDKREMAVIERATHVQASDGERMAGGAMPSVRDHPALRRACLGRHSYALRVALPGVAAASCYLPARALVAFAALRGDL